MATKRQRGGSWHYVIRRARVLPRPIYLSFADELEGDRYVRRLERLLDQGIVPEEFQRPEAPEQTLRGLVRGYLAEVQVAGEDARILERFLVEEALPDRPALGLDYDWALGVVQAEQARRVRRNGAWVPLAPGTIRHRVGALARCLDWAARRGYLTANPLRLLPKGYAQRRDGARADEARERRLSGEEEAAVRRVLAGGSVPADQQRALVLAEREAHALLFELALETAMRLSELYTLERGQVELAQRTVFLERSKNGDRRQVPLSSVAVQALRGYLALERPGPLLLPFHQPGAARAQTTSRLSRLWGRIFAHAGCPDVRFHDLRHEATCRFYERTRLTDLEISRITGHRDPRMLRRYANLRGSDLASKLW